MLRTRVIPCLLMKGTGLYKGTHFENHRYIGDPMNAVRIFCTKEVDELLLVDITATAEKRLIDISFVQRVAKETLMPLTVGGGIQTVEQAQALFSAGAEKILCGTAGLEKPGLVSSVAAKFGAQSIVVSIDVRRRKDGRHQVYTHSGKVLTKKEPVEWAREMEASGAGEILLNSIDGDGTAGGFDLELIKSVSAAIKIPVIACGGAGKIEDFRAAVVEAGATAVSAGSMFVFHGPRKAVLISFPEQRHLSELFQENHVL
jgi:imidazole glycerol-phosphate synthase subunit HisF